MRYRLDASGKTSVQTIQLHDRRTQHKAAAYEMGFDGTKTWIVGDKKEVPTSNPDFYHNLDFYFFAIPFVIADPGVILQNGSKMQAEGKTYDVLEVSYGANVGAAPKDVYKLLLDPTTHRMAWLTVFGHLLRSEQPKDVGQEVLDWKKLNFSRS